MTTRREERRAKRAQESRKVTYKPPSELEIDKEVEYEFKKKGFALRWIRFMTGDTEDNRNVAKRIKEGYEMVKPSELPDHFTALLDDYTSTKSGSKYVTVGDLALAKIRLELQESRTDYFTNQAYESEHAIKREIAENGADGRQIYDSGRSEVATGSKSAKFLS